jgi:hypothetical protein
LTALGLRAAVARVVIAAGSTSKLKVVFLELSESLQLARIRLHAA